jgi:RNA polymerase sigma-70 factor, ECF subfamily
MEERSDRDLWHRAVLGSDAAFEVLFRRHASTVYNYCFRRTAEWATAEDLMAATFLEAWRRRDEIRLSGDSLRPWLLGVATNLMRNHRRSNRRLQAVLERLAVVRPNDDLADDVAGRVDDQRRMQALLELISGLQLSEQELVAMLWSELSYEDAAIALDVPVGTIKSRISRLRAKLRELGAGRGHLFSEGSALARASGNQRREVER